MKPILWKNLPKPSTVLSGKMSQKNLSFSDLFDLQNLIRIQGSFRNLLFTQFETNF